MSIVAQPLAGPSHPSAAVRLQPSVAMSSESPIAPGSPFSLTFKFAVFKSDSGCLYATLDAIGSTANGADLPELKARLTKFVLGARDDYEEWGRSFRLTNLDAEPEEAA